MNNNLRNLVQPVQELSSQSQVSPSDSWPGVDPNAQTQSYHDSVVNSLSGKYKQLAQLNPWMKYDYTPTLWDNIGNFIGFDTQEDAIRREMQTSAKQVDSQLLQQQFQNEYNSEQAKAERMRVAGMNPDLQGTSGVSDSSDFDDSQPRPNVSQTESSNPMDFLNVMMNLFGGTLSALNTFNGFRKTAADLETQEATRAGIDIDNLSKLKDLAGFVVPSLFGSGNVTPQGLYFNKGHAYFRPNGKAGYRGNSGTIDPAIKLEPSIPYINRYGDYNDAIFNMMTQNLGQLANTYGDYVKFGKNRQEAASLSFKDKDGKWHSPISTELPIGQFDKTFRDIFGSVASQTARLLKRELEFKDEYFRVSNNIGVPNYRAMDEAGRGLFNSQYWLKLNQEGAGTTKAEAQNYQFISERDRLKMQKSINHIYENMVDMLSRKSSDGDLTSTFLLMQLGKLLSGVDTYTPKTPETLQSGLSMFGKLLF